MISKLSMVRKKAAVTCLKRMINQYVPAAIEMQFYSGFKLQPINIYIFLHANLLHRSSSQGCSGVGRELHSYCNLAKPAHLTSHAIKFTAARADYSNMSNVSRGKCSSAEEHWQQQTAHSVGVLDQFLTAQWAFPSAATNSTTSLPCMCCIPLLH